jgi:hypothetical protein
VAALLLSAAAGLGVTRTTHVADHVAPDPLSAAKHEVVELQARANAAKMKAAALKANVGANVKLMAPESAKVDPWAMLTAKHEVAVPPPLAASELAAQPLAAGQAVPQVAPMTVNMMSVAREPKPQGFGPEKPEPDSATDQLKKDQERAKTLIAQISVSHEAAEKAKEKEELSKVAKAKAQAQAAAAFVAEKQAKADQRQAQLMQAADGEAVHTAKVEAAEAAEAAKLAKAKAKLANTEKAIANTEKAIKDKTAAAGAKVKLEKMKAKKVAEDAKRAVAEAKAKLGAPKKAGVKSKAETAMAKAEEAKARAKAGAGPVPYIDLAHGGIEGDYSRCPLTGRWVRSRRAPGAVEPVVCAGGDAISMQRVW